MKNENVKSFAVLMVICVAVAALMAVVNYFTAPIIKQNEEKKITETLLVVMPDGVDFEKMEFEGLPSTVKAVYKEKNGGYVFKLTTTGYKNNLSIMCGIDADGTVTGTECIQSEETLGAEKSFPKVFDGLGAGDITSVDTVSGATLTTGAIKNAVNDAFKAFEIIREGGNN